MRNITDADVTELHSEILSVFDATDIITPDQLRGNASSLKEALIDAGGRCAWCRAGQVCCRRYLMSIDAHFSSLHTGSCWAIECCSYSCADCRSDIRSHPHT